MPNEEKYNQSILNKSRKDKFIMVFSVPFTLQTISTLNPQTSDTQIQPKSVQFSVFGAVVPPVIIPATEARYSGQTLNVSSHSREPYPPLEVKFTLDNRFSNYWVIYQWLNLLNNDSTGIYDQDDLASTVDPILIPQYKPKNKLNPAAKLNTLYKTDISIFGLDEYNKRSIEFIYTQAFPTELAGINYNYRDPAEVESSFVMSYSQFLVKPVEFVDQL